MLCPLTDVFILHTSGSRETLWPDDHHRFLGKHRRLTVSIRPRRLRHERNVRTALSTPQNTLDARYDSGDGQHLNDAGHAVVFQHVKAVLDSGGGVRVMP